MDNGHAYWRVWIFGSGKSNVLKEREDAALHKILCNGCLLGRRIATFSPSLSLCQISIACGREPWLRCNLTSFHLEKCKKTICLKLSWRIITFIVILILIIADCRKRIFVIDLSTHSKSGTLDQPLVF